MIINRDHLLTSGFRKASEKRERRSETSKIARHPPSPFPLSTDLVGRSVGRALVKDAQSAVGIKTEEEKEREAQGKKKQSKAMAKHRRKRVSFTFVHKRNRRSKKNNL